jgi:hypothetical protein
MSQKVIKVYNGRASIKAAARAIGKKPAFVRKLVDEGRIVAYRVGGSDAAPRLQVILADLEAYIRRDCVYVPPGLRKRHRQQTAGRDPTTFHPLVADW